MLLSLYWWFKRTENFEVIGLVVLSTQLHEEMDLRFPITCNRDYSVFRTLTFISLFRFYFYLIATKFLVRLNHKLMSFETYSGIFFFVDTVLFKFETWALRPEVCEMDGNFRLQNGLNLLCRV